MSWDGFLPRLQVARGTVAAARDFARVWPTVATWAALAGIEAPLDGDLVDVTAIDASSNSGRVRYTSTGSRWELLSATFGTCTAMAAFAQPIRSGAVCTSAGRSFVRHTFASDRVAGGVARDEWLPPYIATRNPFLRHWAVGTEASQAVLEDDQGNTVYTSGAATKTLTIGSGFVRLQRSGASGSIGLQPTGVTATASLAYYTRMVTRADVPAGYAALVFLADGARILLVGQVAGGQLTHMTAAAVSASSQADDTRTALATTSGAAEFVETVDSGRSRNSEVWRGGRLYSAYSRNIQASASTFITGPLVNSSSGTVTMDVAHFVGVTFTP